MTTHNPGNTTTNLAFGVILGAVWVAESVTSTGLLLTAAAVVGVIGLLEYAYHANRGGSE